MIDVGPTGHLSVTTMQRLAAELSEMIREQIEYRELLYRMTARDLTLRYKQTAMGFGWAVFMPLLNTAVFSVIFMRIAPIDTDGIPYPMFAFTGLLAWNYFSSSLRFAVNSLASNAVLVGKVYFPREIFPLSAVLVSAFDCLVASTVLVLMMIYYQQPVGWPVLALPVVFAVQSMLTLGLGLILAMANLFYRDIKYLFEVMITIWMFATSVLYPVAGVGGWAGVLLQVNPMTPIIDAYRSVLFRETLPLTAPFALATILSLLVLALGWLSFHRSEFDFAENV
jgi:ABC-type polysaccharide/polyol phosphate export permease